MPSSLHPTAIDPTNPPCSAACPPKLEPFPASEGGPALALPTDWRESLPVLESEGLCLRELRTGDSATLAPALGTEHVTRYIEPPPPTVAGFEEFIRWTHSARSKGRHACFGVVPVSVGEPVGIFQIWRLDSRFGVAEWGFVLGEAFWGSGIFEKASALMLEFAFETIGVHRVEGRSAVANSRGNGALRKIGAEREGVLRECFELNGQPCDHVMWAMLARQWRERHR